MTRISAGIVGFFGGAAFTAALIMVAVADDYKRHEGDPYKLVLGCPSNGSSINATLCSADGKVWVARSGSAGATVCYMEDAK